MKYFKILVCVFMVIGSLHEQVYAQKHECSTDCQEQYVKLFVSILGKDIQTMEDYYQLYSEPEGPEGILLFNKKKKLLKGGKIKDRMQEMMLAGDAFDEVMRRDKKNKSEYLACLHKRYIDQLPKLSENIQKTEAREKGGLETIAIGKNVIWKFKFSPGEKKADSIIPPDGARLGSMIKDPCLN